MSIEHEIKKAIEDSVEEMGQDDSVSRQIIAWLEAINKNTLSDSDKAQRLELIYESIKVQNYDED
ncbi:CxC ATPase DNA modification system associated small protein [Cyanothece sp. BG0011]|uniref:CxC ATPase DNA modification system associated small protein n=1 Tax=Cyanothece sp. BG0011 TaxID=2082950 RepID=UPI000D1FD518|nr:CxC ATPase DNA modification system associated small protein [Cyanothece sp. BG0011]